MKTGAIAACVLLCASLLAIASHRVTPVHGASHASWNPHSAAHYLDARELWWQQWPPARESGGTVCISCHTTVPYAMARPSLSRTLDERTPPAPEQVMRVSINKRVTQWPAMVPFYSDARNGPGKTAQSHATEAVLNAAILANADARAGHIRPITRSAFDAAWSLQLQTGIDAGGWLWQDFHLAPWESADSAYQGATLLLLSAVNAPDAFDTEPANRQHLTLLRAYLRSHYAGQPLLNQLYILWASAKDPNLLAPADHKTLLTQIHTLQQPDGGWRTSSLAPRDRSDHTPQPTSSDGYATALTLLALQAAIPSDAAIQRGLNWLTTHQQQDGSWSAASLNKERDPESDSYLFMTDAATAYATLALEAINPR